MAKLSPLVLAPPVAFLAIAGLFLFGMFRENPDVLPSAQEGFPAPQIEPVAVGDLPVLDQTALTDAGVKVVNFWASWCAPCRVEHPFLIELANVVPVYGVNRDRAAAPALAFLEELGNPYSAITFDADNRQSIEWGVYALPETFVIDGQGEVIYHLRGPINHPLYENRIIPAIEAASAE